MSSWFKRRERDAPADWRDAALFAALSERELDRVADHVSHREVAQGEAILEEGKASEVVFVLAAGRAAVLKSEDGGDRELEIGTLEAGDIVGELGILNPLPATASVRMKEAGSVWALHLAPPAEPGAADDLSGIRDEIVRNLGSVVSDHLREQSHHSVALLKRRAVMGDFVVKVLVLLSMYVLFAEGLEELRGRRPSDTYYVDLPLQLLFGLGAYRFIRSTGYPLAQFGLGLRDLFGSLVEGVAFSVPFLGVVTGAKWLLQQGLDSGAVSLIAHPDLHHHARELKVWLPIAVYAFTCFVQELIVRGALQSSLESWLIGRHRRGQAVVVSALLFAVTHLHIGFVFAVLTFVPGLFWGWLFSRHRNLVGVTISHIVVGVYVFFVMGLPL